MWYPTHSFSVLETQRDDRQFESDVFFLATGMQHANQPKRICKVDLGQQRDRAYLQVLRICQQQTSPQRRSRWETTSKPSSPQPKQAQSMTDSGRRCIPRLLVLGVFSSCCIRICRLGASSAESALPACISRLPLHKQTANLEDSHSKQGPGPAINLSMSVGHMTHAVPLSLLYKPGWHRHGQGPDVNLTVLGGHAEHAAPHIELSFVHVLSKQYPDLTTSVQSACSQKCS